MIPTLPTHPAAVYWVGSDSETPLRIMVTHEAARTSGYRYLDAFNIAGLPVMAYKLLDDESAYTTEF